MTERWRVMSPEEIEAYDRAHPAFAERKRRTARRLWREHGPSVRVDFNGPFDRTPADDGEWLLSASVSRLELGDLFDEPLRWVGATVLAYEHEGPSCVARIERVRHGGAGGHLLLSLRLDRATFMDPDPEADR